MAITTYALLQTAMTTWLDRSDLTSYYADAISLFEAAVNRELTVRQQVTTTTLTPSNGAASLPSDFLKVIRLTWAGTPRSTLEYTDPDTYQQYFAVDPSDTTPTHYTIEGSTVRINSSSTTGLTLAYAQKVPGLASTDPNWLLTSHPDGYLFGSLGALKTMTAGEDARGAAIAEFETIVQGIVRSIKKMAFSSLGTPTIRVDGATP